MQTDSRCGSRCGSRTGVQPKDPPIDGRSISHDVSDSAWRVSSNSGISRSMGGSSRGTAWQVGSRGSMGWKPGMSVVARSGRSMRSVTRSSSSRRVVTRSSSSRRVVTRGRSSSGGTWSRGAERRAGRRTEQTPVDGGSDWDLQSRMMCELV